MLALTCGHVMGHRQQGGKALPSACVNRSSAHRQRNPVWTYAKVPARRSAITRCLFLPSFALCLPRLSLRCLPSFVPLPSSSHISPLSCLLLLIFSHLLPPTPLPLLLAAVSCSTHLPFWQGPVCHFCPSEQILRSNPLSNSFLSIYKRVIIPRF